LAAGQSLREGWDVFNETTAIHQPNRRPAGVAAGRAQQGERVRLIGVFVSSGLILQ
jgi:hypothetical protein